MRRRFAAAVLALACSAVPLFGQEKKPADDNRPTLTFRDGEAVKPLTVARADVKVMITGYLAETTLTLTFKNDHSRVLEGELNFPLPQGATVSGYGLDVGGVLVNGVPVEKHQARVAYETELRKGVDPGLVEHVKGNNFRTRVYPIPANGTRTVKVQYVSDLAQGDDGATYVLPLNWSGERIAECNLHVQLQQTPVAPKLRGGPGELAFVNEDAKTIAKRTYKDVAFTDDLTISLPAAPPRHVVVESRQTNDGKTEHHFVVHDTPQRPLGSFVHEMPSRIGILWDASMSRASADKSRELLVLRRLMGHNKLSTFDLVVFRDKPEPAVSFKAGEFDKLQAHLEKLPYDGATNFSTLPIRKADYAFHVLFTDGLANLMDERPRQLEAPLYIFSNDARAAHDSLAHLASTTGGEYLNLKRIAGEPAITLFGFPPFALLSIDAPPGTVADLLPAGVTPVQGRLAISGKLIADEATLTLNYGIGTRVMHKETVTLRKSSATATGLAPRFWAQQKITELAPQAEKNKDALLALGREFNLVTPNTSLMVLETLEQHLTHDIAPAKSRGEMYAAYMKESATRRLAKEKQKADKSQQVVAMWDKRLEWHAKEFKVDPGFKYVAPPVAAGRPVAGDRLVAGALAGDPALAPVDGRPASRPQGQAPEAPRPIRNGEARGDEVTPRGRVTQSTAGVAATDASNLRSDVRRYAALSLESTARSKDGGGEAIDALIKLAGWDPQTPYLKALQQSKPEDHYATYLKQRGEHAQSPAFYLDCADFFLSNNDKEIGLRILTNVAELELDSPALLRIVAHRLNQIGQIDLAVDLFEKVLKLRPEEPQSYRDLALALADRNQSTDRTRALSLLKDVVTKPWDNRFPEIETIALLEYNRLAAAMGAKSDLHPRLQQPLDADIRIVMTWDADLTDIDLWVTEPTGEKCAYDHPATTIGGALSKDFTGGYGPEEYLLKKALPGKYKVQANFYGSGQQRLTGPATVQATVITNFGRPDEKRQAFTVRLTSAKEVVDLGTIEFGEKK